LNFLTIHGKSRFPGLHIWTSEGKKLLVKIPDGCLLVQAGKQMEWLTAGAVKAGFHEVLIVPSTIDVSKL
jgi:isopenicillin N synthase-like dioxygenase